MGNKRFGVMLDVSRNAVMNLCEIKNYIDTLYSIGYNMIQLYTEDTFEVEGEPYFGYMRGRYTQADLKEIDAYCKIKGVELIPCVHTLAHLNAIFRWNEYQKICDVNDILLLNEPRTYELIENIFKTIKNCYSSKIVHVGMDEAHMIGLGKYLDKYGYQNRFDILINHLNKVIEIAKKYDLQPLIWSDMFFRLINHGNYYLEGDMTADAVDSIKDKIPKDVGLVYWDYYNDDKAMYDKMFDAHKRMSDNVWFAGGAWTWRGFAPLNKYSLKTMLPAMNSCRENGIDNVLITMWGDDGAECSRYAVLSSLYYIKRVYDGQTDLEKIKVEFKQITGEEFDAFMCLDLPNYVGDYETNTGAVSTAKAHLYNDLLRGYLDVTIPEDSDKFYLESAKILSGYMKGSKYAYVFDTQVKLCELLAVKSTLGIKIHNAYDKKDKKALKECVKEIDVASKKLQAFYKAFCYQWNKENKPHGFDIQDIRLGGLMQRFKHCKQILNDYISGKIDSILELEEKLIDYPNENQTKKGSIAYNSWMKVASVNCMYHV